MNQYYWEQPEQPVMQMPVEPPKRRRSWPAIVAVLALVLLVAGVGIVFATRKKGDVTASAVSATSVAEDNGAAAPADTDSDRDGLSDQDEARYKSNPNLADTDSDGFNDGTEVANGYNPNGAGTLTTGANVGATGTPPAPQPVEKSGVELSQVYSGSGSYTCQVTGGVDPNTVTVKVKDGKVKQETPINESTAIFIIDGTRFFMNGFRDAKWLELRWDPAAGTASGPGANVKGGIFASEQLVLAANPSKIVCEEANWPDNEFAVPADRLLKAE